MVRETLHRSGQYAVAKDDLKIDVRMGVRLVLQCFNTAFGMSLGPGAFQALVLLMALSTSCLVSLSHPNRAGGYTEAVSGANPVGNFGKKLGVGEGFATKKSTGVGFHSKTLSFRSLTYCFIRLFHGEVD